ncbi:fibronectin type III domain-containing protein [Caballeronia sp. LZ033]|uniref:fibronectin type III domain-containing protein n=1 Tax=Caballeronia sp. LZ033 TaxID=3038566 RepID=UPI002861ED4C|nr:fibronectin type III domain-containing protein [Caballeronia sp. LZ033]MDR5816074.1 fibronectin type III domain-containing protein [Caballeronia sp. LZ033]
MVTKNPQDSAPLASRRGFLKFAGASGLATAAGAMSRSATATTDTPDGTPEQIHLTWGEDPSSEVVINWASLAQATAPRVRLQSDDGHAHMIHAVQRTYTDGLNGEIVCTYHARLRDLRPDTQYHYEVTADNDSNAGQPFTSSFRTAPRGRHAFRFTSYGDLATPNTNWVLSSPQSRFAVQAVERFEPLFHLLNGDLCYANLNPASQPDVWRDFGNNAQTSAANRPWMPCPGNHEIEFHNGRQGFDSYLTRYTLPDNGTRFPGRWYSFRVSSVLFISLDSDDVVYQDGAAFVAGPNPLVPAASTGNPPIAPGTSFYVRGYSQGEQSRWLEKTLREASHDDGIDWIIVQMHQDALSSSKTGNGSDKGIREAWLPLFDRYGVDLVLCGHDHDYERSHPVRGCNHHAGRDAVTGERVDTLQPRPVHGSPRANDPIDTSHGTVHLILGGGGTSAPLDVYGTDTGTGLPQAQVFTKPNRPVPGTTAGTFVRPVADAVEDAIWSAQRDTGTGYGIAVFDHDPGEHGGRTSITINYYHAPGADKTPTADYALFETIVLEKRRGR